MPDRVAILNEMERVRAATVLVAMDLIPESPTHREAIELPDDLRQRFVRFREG